MALRILSVAGEALNFGSRRMETIARVAWLPIVLLLIVNMATVFAFLSIVAGRIITFSDVPSLLGAQQLAALHVAQGWQNHPNAMLAITAGNLIVQAILIASFMAPLIRYAGLGEKPRPGVVRLAFGSDQLRYIFSGIFSFLFIAILILAPIATATYYVVKYIFEALSETMASFPDPNSLHTIELINSAEAIAAHGLAWIYNLALPLAAVAPFVVVLWLLVFFHFHPRNRPASGDSRNPVLRGVLTLFLTATVLGLGYWFLRQGIIDSFKTVAGAGANVKDQLFTGPVNAALFMGIVSYVLVSYFNLRLYPYPGVAVCRRSMALGNTLSVSRGWNIIRLQVILIVVGLFLFLMQTYVINLALLGVILPTIVQYLYSATAVSTKLVNSGVTAEWVLPLFIWIWSGVKILINIFWAFFSYGVAAGLYGRLYRDSEQVEAAS